MSSTANATTSDSETIEAIFERIAADLGMIIDKEIRISSVSAGRETKRPAGQEAIHISFKLGVRYDGEAKQGCLLIPLPDAITIASYLMMIPDESVEVHRAATELDRSMKDAILEVGNFIGGAADAVLRGISARASVRAEGCQGVRPDIRPALAYQEGSELVVGRAQAQVAGYPPFEALLLLPPPPAAE